MIVSLDRTLISIGASAAIESPARPPDICAVGLFTSVLETGHMGSPTTELEGTIFINRRCVG